MNQSMQERLAQRHQRREERRLRELQEAAKERQDLMGDCSVNGGVFDPFGMASGGLPSHHTTTAAASASLLAKSSSTGDLAGQDKGRKEIAAVATAAAAAATIDASLPALRPPTKDTKAYNHDHALLPLTPPNKDTRPYSQMIKADSTARKSKPKQEHTLASMDLSFRGHTTSKKSGDERTGRESHTPKRGKLQRARSRSLTDLHVERKRTDSSQLLETPRTPKRKRHSTKTPKKISSRSLLGVGTHDNYYHDDDEQLLFSPPLSSSKKRHSVRKRRGSLTSKVSDHTHSELSLPPTTSHSTSGGNRKTKKKAARRKSISTIPPATSPSPSKTQLQRGSYHSHHRASRKHGPSRGRNQEYEDDHHHRHKNVEELPTKTSLRRATSTPRKSNQRQRTSLPPRLSSKDDTDATLLRLSRKQHHHDKDDVATNQSKMNKAYSDDDLLNDSDDDEDMDVLFAAQRIPKTIAKKMVPRHDDEQIMNLQALITATTNGNHTSTKAIQPSMDGPTQQQLDHPRNRHNSNPAASQWHMANPDQVSQWKTKLVINASGVSPSPISTPKVTKALNTTTTTAAMTLEKDVAPTVLLSSSSSYTNKTPPLKPRRRASLSNVPSSTTSFFENQKDNGAWSASKDDLTPYNAEAEAVPTLRNLTRDDFHGNHLNMNITNANANNSKSNSSHGNKNKRHVVKTSKAQSIKAPPSSATDSKDGQAAKMKDSSSSRRRSRRSLPKDDSHAGVVTTSHEQRARSSRKHTVKEMVSSRTEHVSQGRRRSNHQEFNIISDNPAQDVDHYRSGRTSKRGLVPRTRSRSLSDLEHAAARYQRKEGRRKRRDGNPQQQHTQTQEEEEQQQLSPKPQTSDPSIPAPPPPAPDNVSTPRSSRATKNKPVRRVHTIEPKISTKNRISVPASPRITANVAKKTMNGTMISAEDTKTPTTEVARDYRMKTTPSMASPPQHEKSNPAKDRRRGVARTRSRSLGDLRTQRRKRKSKIALSNKTSVFMDAASPIKDEAAQEETFNGDKREGHLDSPHLVEISAIGGSEIIDNNSREEKHPVVPTVKTRSKVLVQRSKTEGDEHPNSPATHRRSTVISPTPEGRRPDLFRHKSNSLSDLRSHAQQSFRKAAGGSIMTSSNADIFAVSDEEREIDRLTNQIEKLQIELAELTMTDTTTDASQVGTGHPINTGQQPLSNPKSIVAYLNEDNARELAEQKALKEKTFDLYRENMQLEEALEKTHRYYSELEDIYDAEVMKNEALLRNVPVFEKVIEVHETKLARRTRYVEFERQTTLFYEGRMKSIVRNFHRKCDDAKLVMMLDQMAGVAVNSSSPLQAKAKGNARMIPGSLVDRQEHLAVED